MNGDCCQGGGLKLDGPVRVDAAPAPTDAAVVVVKALDSGMPGVPLCDLPAGVVGIVSEHGLEARDAAMLRAMGLKPNATVRVCRQGEPCIVEVLAVPRGSGPCGCDCATRIGLARDLASRVMVVRKG